MRKLICYIDTSVFNFLLSGSEVAKDITRMVMNKLLDEGEIYISEVVMREINAAPEPKRSQLVEEIRKYSPKLLEVNSEIQALAKKYVEAGVIPSKYFDDALHIATATVYDLSVIISWNFEHIVKLKTRREVNGINILSGYREVEICSPEEVF